MNTHTEATGDYFGLCLPFFQGQKPGLTDVQAELDRMTRKHDSMVSANNVSPPTENEAWRQHKRLHRPLHWYSGTVHVHLSRKIDQIPNVCHRTQWFHQNDFRMLSDILVFWWAGKRVCGSLNERSTGGLALFLCFLPLWVLFCEGHQLMEIWPHYLAARPMC